MGVLEIWAGIEARLIVMASPRGKKDTVQVPQIGLGHGLVSCLLIDTFHEEGGFGLSPSRQARKFYARSHVPPEELPGNVVPLAPIDAPEQGTPGKCPRPQIVDERG